ncbi:MAG: LysR family transcriptional regulator [Azospirillaceae bacterium]
MTDKSAASTLRSLPASSRMSMRQLEAFVAVVEGGGISAGAALLNISQPSVSRLVADLERSVGFLLFQRDRQRLTITPEGSRFHDEVAKSFAGIDRLTRVAKDIRNLTTGSLRVATVPALAFEITPRAIAAFTRGQSRVRVLCEQRSSQHILEAVAAQDLDVGVALGRGPVDGLDTVARFSARCVCVCPADNPLAALDRVTVDDLLHQPFIGLPRYTMVRMQLETLFADRRIDLDIRTETLISSMACSLVSHGLGVSIVDPFTAEVFEGDRLAARPFLPEIAFDFRVVRAARRRPSRLADAFIERLRQEIQADARAISVC